jgi:hypothetical protein
MIDEAEMRDTPAGKVPAGEGWFVLTARRACAVLALGTRPRLTPTRP